MSEDRVSLLQIIFAYFISCFVAGFLFFAFQVDSSISFGFWLEKIYDHISLVIPFVILVFVFSIIPSIIFIIYIRENMIRTLLPYIGFSILLSGISFVLPTLDSIQNPSYGNLLSQALLSGLCAGLAFWFFAGKRI